MCSFLSLLVITASLQSKLGTTADCSYNAKSYNTAFSINPNHIKAKVPTVDTLIEGFLTKYLALPNAQPFIIPISPGNVMVAGMAGTAHVIADAVRAHPESLRQYHEYDIVMQALCKQIVDCVEEKFSMSLKTSTHDTTPSLQATC